MTANTGENEALFLIAGWNINWQSHYGKQNGDPFEKVKIDQPCDQLHPHQVYRQRK